MRQLILLTFEVPGIMCRRTGPSLHGLCLDVRNLFVAKAVHLQAAHSCNWQAALNKLQSKLLEEKECNATCTGHLDISNLLQSRTS